MQGGERVQKIYQVDMSGWGFVELRKWLIDLRSYYSNAPIEELIELDKQAQEFWEGNHENRRHLTGGVFSLVLISLRSPLPRLYAPNKKGKEIEVVKPQDVPEAPLMLSVMHEMAEENKKDLDAAFSIDTLEYRRCLQEYIKRDRSRAYIIEGEFNGDYLQLIECPERFKLHRTKSKAPQLRTGNMADLKSFGIHRSIFKRWMEYEDNGKKFLFALSFALGLDSETTDYFLHKEGYSYMESVHPIDRQVGRAIMSGYSYEMLQRILDYKGLSF